MDTARVAARRIGLFGHFGAGNLGNEASLEVVLGFIRRERPGAQILCICTNPETTRLAHDVLTVPITKSNPGDAWSARLNRLLAKIPGRVLDVLRAYHEVRNLDVLVIPGTGILDDFGERPGGMPYALCKWLIAARLAGCRILCVSIGAGPIHNPMSRRLMTTAARMAHYRSFRDAVSKTYLAGCGVDTRNDPVVPDVAFALPPPESRERTPGPVTVGVGVMNYWGWQAGAPEGAGIHDAYLGKLADFVQRLLSKSYRVRLLIGQRSDAEAIDRVLRRVAVSTRESEALICEPAASLRDLMRQIQQTDVVVTTRYHNVVSALSVGKPVISLSYAEKNDVLLDDVGLRGFYQHCATFDVDHLCEQLDSVLAQRGRFSLRIVERVSEYRRQLAEQDMRLLSDWL